MKKMLISIQSSEIVVATIQDTYLVDLDIENYDTQSKKTNIYRGKIARIEPSLDAVFVDYGEVKHGFLPFKEIAPDYLRKTNKSSSNISDLLYVGQYLIVQIVKEVRRNKGASLTTYIALAGCYIVLLPNSPTVSGISRCTDLQQRNQLKKILDQLNIPSHMGVIMRTAAIGYNFVDIKNDLQNLLLLWESIQIAGSKSKGVELLYRESNVTIRAIRDYLKDDIEEIIVDDQEIYQELRQVLHLLKPKFLKLLYLYTEQTTTLFEKFKIDDQIENVFKRQLNLQSGGSIIIEHTEALTAIDINSARSTKGENIEVTAFITNMEATTEIARQLRLRDVSGLIIIDFIDMNDLEHQEQVEDKLAQELSIDRARIQMTKISKLGIVELSRQHLKSPIRESVMQLCPQCQGHGRILSIRACATLALKKIRQSTHNLDAKTQFISVQLPLEVATHILNYSKIEILNLENIYNTKIIVTVNDNLTMPNISLELLGLEHMQPLMSSHILKRPILDFTATMGTKENINSKQDNFSDKRNLFLDLFNSLKGILGYSSKQPISSTLDTTNMAQDIEIKTYDEEPKENKISKHRRLQVHKKEHSLISINEPVVNQQTDLNDIVSDVISATTFTSVSPSPDLELKEENLTSKSSRKIALSKKKLTSSKKDMEWDNLPAEVRHAITLKSLDILQVETVKKADIRRTLIKTNPRISNMLVYVSPASVTHRTQGSIKYSPSLDTKRQGYK